jgi:transcriptional regulator with XRE-family HTH domain
VLTEPLETPDAVGTGNAELGRSIKLRRSARGLSLRVLASRARCSASFLSMIEQGRISPSVKSLKRICEGLDTTVSDLLRLDEPAPEPIVVRRSEAKGRVIMKWDRAVARLLLPSNINCQFTLMMMTVKPGGQTSLRISDHPLPEVHFVLRGNPTFVVNDTNIDLKAGDYVYLDLTRPHKVVNRTRATVEILLINASRFRLISDLEGNEFAPDANRMPDPASLRGAGKPAAPRPRSLSATS